MEGSPRTVSTCARSFKFSAHISKNPSLFEPFIHILIKLIGEKDLAVKKNSLESLSQIVFNNHLQVLLEDKVEEVVVISLAETPIKKELIITVDLGPFKHTVDNGSQIRKAAFTLLENISDKFSFN